MKIINFKHSGHLGDIIYSLPFLKAVLKKFNADKASFIISKNKKYFPPPGQHHICGPVWISQEMFDFIYPLLIHQDYIHDVQFIEEHLIPENNINLDIFRSQNIINLAAGSLKDYYFKAYGLAKRSNEFWIKSQNSNVIKNYDVIISRSTRYTNSAINYLILDDICNISKGFLGTNFEYQQFLLEFPESKIDYIHVANSFEASVYLSKCNLFIGNQSFFFSIAEGMQINRLLETCELCPNVISDGGVSGQFLTNHSFVNLLNELLNINLDINKFKVSAPSFVYSKELIHK